MLHNAESLAARFENSVTHEIRAVTTEFLLSRDLSLEYFGVEMDFYLFNVSALTSQQKDCTWLVYQLNQTHTGNGTVAIIDTGRTYASGMFQIVDENIVIVCETNLSAPDGEMRDADLALSIITFTGFLISIICFIIRIALQFCVSSFRNRPGKLQLHLTIALLITFVMVIAAAFLPHFPEACIVSAILLVYTSQAAFIWMNVIAVDTWLVFRPSAAYSRVDDEGRSLLIHIICGWGIPLLLVTASIGMNYSDVDEQFSPEFGGPICWYTQRYAMLLYFVLPIAISILVNIILYILTSVNLHKAFRSGTHINKNQRYPFGVYVRLFILMGFTWIFGLISTFTDAKIINYIYAISASFQGLFFLISSVCNKRVLREIRKKTKRKASTSGKQTNSTSFDSQNACESKI